MLTIAHGKRILGGKIMLRPKQYRELIKRINKFEQWRGNRTSYRTADVPVGLAVTNEERSAVEVYEFVENPPERYFLYIKQETCQTVLGGDHNVSGRATTWTGEPLGDVGFGREFRSNWGDRRIDINVYAINGRTYNGTYYKSAGDYARVKMCKGSKAGKGRDGRKGRS
jgi:hypothetical protein